MNNGAVLYKHFNMAVKKKPVKKKVSAKRPVKTKVNKVPEETAILPESKMPPFISPMLAVLGDEPYDDDESYFEIKHDGYRTIAVINGNGKVNLFSRNQKSFNTNFKLLITDLSAITEPVILDGEVVVENEKGASKFQLLQQYMKYGKGELKYYVFDIMHLQGHDLRGLPLEQRKELLRMLLGKYDLAHVYFSEHVQEEGLKLFKSSSKAGLEGIIAKKKKSLYLAGKRSDEWLKIKINKEEEAIICGLTDPKGGRQHFGAILLGVYEKGKLRYAGKCGTGFNEKTLQELYKLLKPYFIKDKPLDEKFPSLEKIQWVKPEIVCQVKFTEWTDDGKMRHPVYLGLRKDKSAKEVTIQKPVSKKTTSATSTKTGIKFSNPDKIYWPKLKITKGDLINYYDSVSEFILPYLKNRPHSLHRFPDGIAGGSFYQKDTDKLKLPEGIHAFTVFSESTGKDTEYLVGGNKDSLLYMANLGCIEINPWHSRISKADYPDWMVIDLDPLDVDFKDVVKTALTTRKILEEAEIDSYCKTSGATGLHIYIPLNARYDYDLVRNFAELIARHVHHALPSITSIERMPSKRKKKVYLDYLQNRKGQTIAAPYSVRPTVSASVSTPLKWEEVNNRLDPAKFTMLNTLKRLEKTGDLFLPVLGKGTNLTAALKKLTDQDAFL